MTLVAFPKHRKKACEQTNKQTNIHEEDHLILIYYFFLFKMRMKLMLPWKQVRNLIQLKRQKLPARNRKRRKRRRVKKMQNKSETKENTTCTF